MELVTVTEHSTLVDPAGQPSRQTIEHRVDPLTGTVASLNLAIGEKARAFVGTSDEAMLADIAVRSRATCPFCSAAEKGTRYDPAFAPEGQLRFGGALAMPNLFGKCRFDSVVILDVANHVLRPSAVGARALADGIRAAADLVRRARAADPAMVHHLVGMNFLPPAGSSVPHPHFQVHVRSVPYSGVARLTAASAAWRARAGRDFWGELLEAERGGPRWVGQAGPVAWLAAFAPLHQREVWGIVPGTGSLAELDEAAATGLAEGISKVVTHYESLGAHPFNVAFLSSPLAGRGGEYALHARVCSRPPLKAAYVNYESWFGPLYGGDDVHMEAPEALAASLRARW